MAAIANALAAKRGTQFKRPVKTGMDDIALIKVSDAPTRRHIVCVHRNKWLADGKNSIKANKRIFPHKSMNYQTNIVIGARILCL